MPIADRTARRIAGKHAYGNASGLACLFQTGAIDTTYPHQSCLAEIDEALDHTRQHFPTRRYRINELKKLRQYVAYHGPRHPVTHWHHTR